MCSSVCRSWNRYWITTIRTHSINFFHSWHHNENFINEYNIYYIYFLNLGVLGFWGFGVLGLMVSSFLLAVFFGSVPRVNLETGVRCLWTLCPSINPCQRRRGLWFAASSWRWRSSVGRGSYGTHFYLWPWDSAEPFLGFPNVNGFFCGRFSGVGRIQLRLFKIEH